MARDQLDGRLVTRCDACGEPVNDDEFVGVPGLTEFLGLGICPRCHDSGTGDIADVLLRSGLLSARGRQAVEGWKLLRAPAAVRDLHLLLHGHPEAICRHLEGRRN